MVMTAIIAAAAPVAAAGMIVVFACVPAIQKPAGDSQAFRLLASYLEERIANSVRVIELTGTAPEVRNTGSISLVSTAQMGIPQDADAAKREVAKNIIATYGDVASIFFLTPE